MPEHIKLHESFPSIPNGTVPGAAILREVPRDLGIHMMRVYRSVMLWVMEHSVQRTGPIFADGGMSVLATELAAAYRMMEDAPGDPLILIACELARDEPDVPRIARACLTVADWAITRGLSATAMAFADAAAIVRSDARYALVAGRLHRAQGEAVGAGQWLRAASILASRDRDWETKSKSLLSIGNTHLLAGRYDQAGALFRQAREIAARHRLREQIGLASHDLLVLAIATRNRKAADATLAEAARSYPSGHHRLPALAHDAAAWWIELHDFESARPVLLSLLDNYWWDDPAARLLVCGTTLRALGGCDRAEEFATLYGEFRRLADTAGGTPRLAQALLSAAHGAVSLREWAAAESLLSNAAEQARMTGQQDTLQAVERMLPQVWDRREESRLFANPRTYRPRTEERSMEWLKKFL